MSWVIEQTKTYNRRDGSPFTVVSYWMGPRHGWGNTWTGKSTDPSVATFDTKEAAEATYRSTLGDLRAGVVIKEIAG